MTTVQGIYVALFGRPADPAGLDFYSRATGNGADLTQVGALTASAEFTARFAGQTDAQIITTIFQSLFDRAPDAAGLNFYLGEVAAGRATLQDIAIRILDGASGADLLILNAKLDAADLFTERLDTAAEVDAYAGSSAAQIGRDFIDSITLQNPATNENTDAAILRVFSDEGEAPNPGPIGDGNQNTSPVAEPTTNNAIEDGDVVTGLVTATDVDGDPLTYTLVAPVAGLTLNTDGSYSFDPSNDAYQSLAAGVTTDVVATYSVTDGQGGSSTSTLTITVTGTNDAPVAQAATNNAVEDGALVTGSVTATDADGDPLTYTLAAPVAGLTLNTDGSYSFDPSNDAYQSLAAGVTTNVVATYSVADGQGGSSTSTLTITVTGTNDAATIAGTATGTVTEDGALTASGILTVSDIDTGEEIFADVDAAALNTDYGTFTFDSATGAWGFILDNDAAQSLAGGQAVTLSLNVSSGDGTANETINVTINGTNDAATISGDMTGSVTEDGALTASGILTVSDIDTGEEIFADVDAAALNTDYGTFTFDSATGGWNFTLDNDAAQSLGANDGVTRSLTVSSIDATASETIVVTINGSNDAATISGDVLGSVTEDGTLDASGTLTVADIDTGENVFAEIDEDDLSTDYGTFTFNSTTGAWKFTLDEVAAQSLGANDVVTRSLTVSSIDGTANQTIVVTINGTNDAATISGDTTGSVTEDGALIASGTLTVADIDTGESVFAEVDENDLSTDYGKFEFNRTTGEWKFTLDNDAAQSLGANDVVTRSLTVSSIDGTASQKINVTITGTNDAATISGDTTGSVTEDGALTASGTLTVADADAGQAAFAPVDAIALTTDYGTFTFDSATGAWGFTLDNDAAQSLAGGEAVTRSLIVLSVDSTATEAIAVTINGTNDAPVFGQANYAFAINENATGVVGSVIATDADVTDALTYSLVSNPAGLFSINGQTGAISLNTPRDFETHAQSYELMVVATDPALATATTTVRVSIQDVVEDSTHDGTSGDDIIDKSGSLNNWTINGLAGNDVITGGLGNDIINGGLGNDTIRGGAGDDRIVLTADGRDTVIFEATASGNGFDTIVDFTAGNTGDSADVLKFDHIIGGVDAASGGVFSGPKVSVFNSTSNYNDNVTGKVVLFDASAADANIIAAEFGPNQSFALNANGKAVVMTGSSGSQKVSIWYVENGSESNGVQANEIFLVGTMSLSVGDIFSFHASNFSFA